MIKRADIGTTVGAVAAPAVGGFLGRAIGEKFHNPNIGALLGTILGGTGGQLLKEKAAPPAMPQQVPPGAPFDIDPNDPNLPTWVVPQKTAAHGGLADVIGGDALGPLYPLGQGIKNKDMGGAMRGIAGQTAGVVGGGLLGHGAGMLLDKAVGHSINVPGINMPLSTILSGLGATVGSVKGLNFARGV